MCTCSAVIRSVNKVQYRFSINFITLYKYILIQFVHWSKTTVKFNNVKRTSAIPVLADATLVFKCYIFTASSISFTHLPPKPTETCFNKHKLDLRVCELLHARLWHKPRLLYLSYKNASWEIEFHMCFSVTDANI